MSQMNKGPFKPGQNATQKMASAQANRSQAEAQIKGAMAPKKAMLGPNSGNASQPGPKAQAAIRQARPMMNQADKTINTLKAGPKGPTIGAGKTAKPGPQSVKLGAQELGAAKLKPQSASLGPKQLGAAKTFKGGAVSNPMGRMGGKPGVNIGTGRK